MSDREKAGLRGPVRTCIEESNLPYGGKYSTTREYSPDGRLLATHAPNSDGSEWLSTRTYHADGRLAKISSGKVGGPVSETLYAYDEAGRLLSITNSPEEGGRTDFRYDEQGRKTTIQTFDPKTLDRAERTIFSGSPWDAAAMAGVGVPVGGKIITIYDQYDQPAEAQIRDAQDRIVNRHVRTYDANGRVAEEKPIWENPSLLMLEKFPDEQRQMSQEQIAQLNKTMGAFLVGKSPAGTTYTYDSQNRITNVHERNMVFERTTTTIYNDQGDKVEERSTLKENSIVPVGVSVSIDENGMHVPPEAAAQVSPLAAVPEKDEIHFAYQYDSYGNWIEQTANYGTGPNARTDVRRRTLTYY
jgi:YD repeat-containing protein